MHIRINIEIFKVLKFDFEASSSPKTKEEKKDEDPKSSDSGAANK